MIINFLDNKGTRITYRRVTSLSYVPIKKHYFIKYKDFMGRLHGDFVSAELYHLECIYDDK